ncbi:hypothetical protein SAMN04488134_10316 [Amphibacillus marinus]|uniref:Uncharacterized protein n=1 Tax=Amphibacillus marinus TaxID=872970 RepID=A0A1H8L025_9BACI|nr:hypothetical protein SAMN04488134_10316 [Amphibacillus marinus]
MLENYEEGYSRFNTWIKKVLKSDLIEILHKSDFFDKNIHLTCDIPMKNLIIELIIGQYGFPYIANAKHQVSLKYKAKDTWMYSDIFVFDHCRYLYNLIPSIDLFKDFFNENIEDQIKIRACIDLILRNYHCIDRQLFRGRSIECLYNYKIPYSTLSDRININYRDTL